jgi:hypothetical protein
MNRRVQVWLCVVVLLLIRAAAADAPKLIPSKTYAVIVGVLKWKSDRLGTYSPVGRKDQELYDALRELGVPAANMTLLLDEKGTLAEIRAALAEMAGKSKTDPETTLIFYYAGHGIPAAGKTYFANYDFDGDPAASAFAVQEVAWILKLRRSTGRVLLHADCCFSGVLGGVAKELNAAGLEAASLTSATDSIPSTSNWTFTHTLVDLLRGRAIADHDRDGSITLLDAAVEIRDAMLFSDRQTAGYVRAGLGSDFVLAPVRGKLPTAREGEFAPGQYVLTATSPARAGRVIERDDTIAGAYRVEFQHYNVRAVEVIAAAGLKAIDRMTFISTSAEEGAPEPLGEADALAKANVGGKYRRLLRKFPVESDWRNYTAFYDYGAYPATSYGGQPSLPAGYWVYVYPHWYIWAEQGEP